MVYNNTNKCCKLVKEHLILKHSSCTSDKKRPPFTRKGSFFNKYCSSSLSPFNDDEDYQMCHNLKRQFDRNRISAPPPSKPPIIPIPKVPAPIFTPIELPVPSTRDERMIVWNAKKIENDYMDLINELHSQNEYLKDALDCVDYDDEDDEDDACSINSEEEGIEEDDDDNEVQEHENKKRKYSTYDYVKDTYGNKFKRKLFKELCYKRRMERVDNIGNRIIGLAIKRIELEQKGTTCIENNELLAHDIMNMITLLIDRLGKKLKIDLREIGEIEACELIDEDEERIQSCERNQKLTDLALSIMGETTGRAYSRISKAFKKCFSRKEESLPSEKKLNELLPIEVEPVLYDVCMEHDQQKESSMDLIFGNSKNVNSNNNLLLSSINTTKLFPFSSSVII